MSSQTRTAGGNRPSKKTNNVTGSAKTVTITKKTEHQKTEKEKVHVKVSNEKFYFFFILRPCFEKRILSSNRGILHNA